MSFTGITLEMCQEKLKMYLKAEEKVFRDTGVNQTTLRNWRSYMNREKGPPAIVKELALSFEDETGSPNQYEALIQLYRENKIV